MSEYSKPIKLLLGGVPVLKCNEKRFSVKSNDQPVYTDENGLDGFSDGAAELDLTLKQAVPLNGYVIAWNVLSLNHTTVRPTIQIANKSYECEGRVMSADTGGAVNKANEVDVSLKLRIVGTSTVAV